MNKINSIFSKWNQDSLEELLTEKYRTSLSFSIKIDNTKDQDIIETKAWKFLHYNLEYSANENDQINKTYNKLYNNSFIFNSEKNYFIWSFSKREDILNAIENDIKKYT